MKRKVFLLALLGFSICVYSQTTAISLQVIDSLKESVFEVVIPRVESSEIKYERALPWDLVPYAIRVDDYLSIGTAFRIESGEILSAAHVFSVITLSQNKNYYLRDGEKNLYKITDVYKYSNYRDFISFKAEGLPEGKGLPLQRQSTLNERVYAVGNAYGEGVVIRDGLLTSYTPEMEEGEWNWIRFSAAASPGNSGGPLINPRGEVIGIITMKSQNENLNYALPIEEYLNAPEKSALAYMKLKYSIPIFFDYFKRGIFSHSVELPMNLQQLSQTMFNAYDRWTGRLVAEIKEEWKDKSFPKGEGSQSILSGVFQTNIPHMVGQGSDGRWGLFRPQQLEETRLEEGGECVHGVLGGFTLASLTFPSGVDGKRFFADSQYMGETVLKGVPLYRHLASERIKVTSLGKAQSFTLYTDAYKRKWVIADYNVSFNDAKLLIFATPTPEGAAVMMKLDTTDAIKTGHLRDFKFMADFLHLSYRGNFLQWERFLQLEKLIPAVVRDVSVKAIPQGVDLACGPISLRYSDSLFDWNNQSLLTVLPGFEKLENGEVDWVVKGFALQENLSDSGTILLNRIFNPGPEADSTTQFMWDKMKKKEQPFDGELHSAENRHQVYQIIEGADENLIYVLTTMSSLSSRKEQIKGEAQQIRKNLRINDFRMSEILNPQGTEQKTSPKETLEETDSTKSSEKEEGAEVKPTESETKEKQTSPLPSHEKSEETTSQEPLSTSTEESSNSIEEKKETENLDSFIEENQDFIKLFQLNLPPQVPQFKEKKSNNQNKREDSENQEKRSLRPWSH